MQPEELNKILTKKDKYGGLSSQEAKERLKIFGYNQRLGKKREGWLKKMINIFTEPMMLLLIATGIVYVLLGDRLEATIVWLSVIPIGLIEFFEEKKTSDAIAVLDKMVVLFAKVYRDGDLQDVEYKNIVPGDLIYMTAGDQVAADGYLIRSCGLSLDESILTGESLSVTKVEAIDGVEKLSEENKMYQGTLVVQGEGYMVVTATGSNTSYGKLGSLLEKIEKQDTPLQKKLHHLVRLVALFGLGFSVLVGLLLGVYRGWANGLLGGLTVAMALIPEEFPVVFSVFLILGMWHLSKEKALVREMVMVEALGSVTVICSDKTGTLTEGRMALEKIYFENKIYLAKEIKNNNEKIQDLIKSSILALEKVAIDPIEIEMQRFANSLKINTEKFFSEHDLVKDSSFDAKTKVVSHIWKNKKNECYQYTVGAPESVIAACVLSATEKKKISIVNEQEAKNGYRVIGVAKKKCQDGEEVELGGLEFCGLLAMSDPPRRGVKEAMRVCKQAGIKVIMITGDNKLTAHNIAESIDMEHDEEIFSGEEIIKMSDQALREAVRRHNIFARVQPEQKYLIVKALQENGEVVAMTGDGVNDAPALRQANIGIAMGQRGTEVARAAAGVVLMDDNFSSIVNAIREGRRIYDNLRSSFVFLLSFHFPIVGLAVLPLFFSHELIFLPVHIIFLELICDPAAVIGFEKEKARRGLMNEPPRPANEPLINPYSWWKVILQGLSITALSFGFYYYYALVLGQPDLGRSLALVSLIVSQVMLIIFTREWDQIKSNLFLTGISVCILISLIIIMLAAPVRELFKLVLLNWTETSLAVGGSIFSMLIVSLIVKRKK